MNIQPDYRTFELLHLLSWFIYGKMQKASSTNAWSLQQSIL